MPRDFRQGQKRKSMCCYSFISIFTAIKVFTQGQYDRDCGFFISLLSVDPVLLPGCANWPSSCFSIMSHHEEDCFFPIIFMHAGQSLSADPSIRCRLIVSHFSWCSVYYVTVFLMSYLQIILKMYCTVPYVAIKIWLLKLNILTIFNPDIRKSKKKDSGMRPVITLTFPHIV